MFFLERHHLKPLVEKARSAWRTATPFHHAIIDGFFPADVADQIAHEFPPPSLPAFKRVDHAEQAGRLGHLQRKGFAGVSPFIRHILNELNAQAFVDFLEEVTGIEGLITDPHFRGAGVHQTLPGGHLALHADYNRDRFRNLERRLTVLMYFNPGWDEAWGGHLELWPPDLKACAVKIAPLHNRVVVMQHKSDAWHGHPAPLQCPPDRTRRSIAAYYYAVDRPADEKREPHSAIWVKT